tara:strand:+ start:124 stop:726 length:603 start_codon:yes stop_codon:yes gene_type:complete
MRTFHDAVVTYFEVQANQLSIGVDSVWSEHGAHASSGVLIVSQLDTLTENLDAKPINAGRYGLDDGLILALRYTENSIELLIDWEAYAPRSRETMHYYARGREVSWTADSETLSSYANQPHLPTLDSSLYKRYRHPDSGQEIDYDAPAEGQPGWGGKAHYHVRNLRATNRDDARLDADGQPTAKGSRASYILPGTSIPRG